MNARLLSDDAHFVLKAPSDSRGIEALRLLNRSGFFPDVVTITGLVAPTLVSGWRRYQGFSGLRRFIKESNEPSHATAS